MTLSLEPGAVTPGYWFVHENGDVLEGDDVEIRGVADPDSLSGEVVGAGARHLVVPVEPTARVVWFGDHGTSYVIWEFDVEPGATTPSPDEGCEWVETESNGGTDDATVDGIVVDCDVTTDKVIELQNGGAVIGDTISNGKEVDADDGTFYGDVEAETNVNVQNVSVVGSVTAETENVKIDDNSVGGSVAANKVVEVIDGSSAGGDLVSDGNLVKVIASDVSGSIATDGSVKLQDATASGDVYVDAADFDCTNSTVDGQSCSEYSPKDPGDY